jgi:enoyl-CoA hydratase/carnithine racemase
MATTSTASPTPHETITVDVDDRGVATVTLDRPEVLNAFNGRMVQELHQLWRAFRLDDAVRCVVLTGAGERAFCTGIDRTEQIDDGSGGARAADDTGQDRIAGFGSTPFHFDDPGELLGPKTNDLWKPVVAAVNGMACGGAFYLLGECDVLIAADHATFFDPHVTYGQAAVYEPMKLLQYVSLGNVMRMMLLGARERISAETALQIGLVTEVVPADQLIEQAGWLAEGVASLPANVSSGTLRAVWAANDLGPLGARSMAPSILSTATDKDVMRAGNEAFENQPRIKPRIR